MRLALPACFVLVLAGCVGDDPVLCEGPACAPATSTALAVSASASSFVVTGSGGELDVDVTRTGFDGAVSIAIDGLPEGVAATPLSLPPGTTKTKVALTATAGAAHGSRSVTVVATAIVSGKTLRGEAKSALLVRGAPGTLDNSFGAGGRAEVPNASTGLTLVGLVVTPDGRVVTGGSEGRRYFAARLDERGALDATYGVEGKALADVRADEGSEELAAGLALGEGGRAVLSGRVTNTNAYALARFDARGKVDATFDGDGTWSMPHPVTEQNIEIDAPAVAVQTDGRIVFGGYSTENRGGSFIRRAMLARLDERGVLDTSFGAGGTGWVSRQAAPPGDPGNPALSSDDACEAVAIAPDGKIVCAGTTEDHPTSPGSKAFFVLRVGPDGREDATFGASGIARIAYVPTAIAGAAVTVHVLADGRIRLAGQSGDRIVAVALDAAGVPEPAFGGSGIVPIDALGAGASLRRPSSAVDASGRMIVAAAVGAENDVTIVRLLPSGAIDGTLSSDGGKIVTKVGVPGVAPNLRVAVAGESRIVVATNVPGRGLVLFRFWT